MHLYDVPLVLALAGLVLYTVLGGADFGAGMQELTAGRGPAGERIREHAHDSMAPVWEANHVWLIFVLTVVWTAYPAVFGSIASTLSIPLFIAAVGIILRGAGWVHLWIDAVALFLFGTMLLVIAARRFQNKVIMA